MTFQRPCPFPRLHLDGDWLCGACCRISCFLRPERYLAAVRSCYCYRGVSLDVKPAHRAGGHGCSLSLTAGP